MNTLVKMAWRNLWRNKKRTILTLLSIFMAIFLSLFTRSMQVGSYNSMIQNAVKFSTGYIQIHKKDYWENKSISETFLYKNDIDSIISQNKNISYSYQYLNYPLKPIALYVFNLKRIIYLHIVFFDA